MAARDRSARRRLRFRVLSDPRELRAAVELQIEVWGMDPKDTMPWSQLQLAGAYGGVVAGAFDGRNLVGFVYSFVAREEGETFLYSKMLGVRASHRGLGIGRTLKRLQRREALRKGLRRIQWTFDPLERASATLNAGYLGVRVRRYRTSFYGPGGIGSLHAGLDTDRLVADWRIADAGVVARQRRRTLPAPPDGAHLLLDLDPLEDRPIAARGRRRFPALVIVPPDIQATKRAAPARARAWQRSVRTALTGAFSAGGEITDLAHRDDERGSRVYYVITRSTRASGRGRRR